MRWLKRGVLAIVVLIVLGVAGYVGSALLSLDWNREHRARTEALPLLDGPSADGLVRIQAGNFEFRARVAGLGNAGPGLVLLHGFPETSLMWAPLLDAAAAAGYRVVAFDQRGYSPGARPEGIDAYRIDALAADVLAVADAANFDRFHLVGHDWGAVVGWTLAASHPERLRSWTPLSIPHPGTMLAEMREEPPDYIRFIQRPWLPELTFSFNRMGMMRSFYESLPAEQQEEYLAVFSEPGALTAGFNWYRAIAMSIDAAGDDVRGLAGPVLFIWGSKDFYASRVDSEQHRALIDGSYEELELDAGHTLIQEETERVVDAILAHLRSVDASPPRASADPIP